MISEISLELANPMDIGLTKTRICYLNEFHPFSQLLQMKKMLTSRLKAPE